MKKNWEKFLKFLRDPATQTIIAIVTLIATITWGSVQGWLNIFINWLRESSNVPNWLFISICILILALGSYCTKTIFAKPKNKSQIVQKPVSSIPLDTYSTLPKAKEIIDQLHQAPPYQRETIKESYQGVKIKWQLRFNDILVIENDIAWIQLENFEKNSSANIYAYINIKENPRIKTIKQGETLYVIGEIEKITDYSTIWLSKSNTMIKFSIDE